MWWKTKYMRMIPEASEIFPWYVLSTNKLFGK